MKRSLALVLMLFLVSIALFASTSKELRLSWGSNDSNINWYRWSSDGDTWTVVPASCDSINIDYEMGESVLYVVQSSYDGLSWSDDHGIFITPDNSFTAVFSWIAEDGDANWYRYRVGKGEWTVVDGDVTKFRLPVKNGKTYVFEAAYSSDGEAWSETKQYVLSIATIKDETEKPKTKVERDREGVGIELVGKGGLAYGSYLFYHGINIPDATYYMGTKSLGFTGSGELRLDTFRWIRPFVGFGYTYVDKKETVIPYANKVEYLNPYVGCDLTFALTKHLEMYLGAAVGPAREKNASYYSDALYVGARFGIEYYISGRFIVGLETGVRVADHQATDPLYDSATFLFDAVALTAGVRF